MLLSMTVLACPVPALAGERKARVLQRQSRPTLVPFGLNSQETLRFRLRNGRAWELTLLKTSAEVIGGSAGKISAYAFECDLRINGKTHHLIRMLVSERTPLRVETAYATTAGVHIGSHEHTHFMFRVIDQGGEYWLDPWILFWEMFRQQRVAK